MTSVEESITKMPLEGRSVDKLLLVAPLASHEDVAKDPRLFSDTLKSFHSALGNKISIPVIGGKDLDLHTLYVEVTRRGGFQKVVEEKKWREVGDVYQFPRTTTSASFVLRRTYQSVLLDYEQVYFLNREGPCIPQSSPAGVPLPGTDASCTVREPVSDPVHKTPCEQQGASGLKGATVLGKISGKFQYGYLVTVQIGSETLSGVLYHPTESALSPGPSSNAANVPSISAPPSNRRKKKRPRVLDPEHPKGSRSAYNFFFAAKHSQLKLQYSTKETNFTKIIGHAWNNLTETEKQVYEEIGRRDKERYQKELSEYEERKQLSKT